MIFISRADRCCRNLMPFMFRLSSPFGPSVLLSGSCGSCVMPTLQLISCPKMKCVSFGRRLSSDCVMPLNSSCSLESTGW